MSAIVAFSISISCYLSLTYFQCFSDSYSACQPIWVSYIKVSEKASCLVPDDPSNFLTGKHRYDLHRGGQIKPNCVERNAPFKESPVSLPLLLVSCSVTPQRCWQGLSQWPLTICLRAICWRVGLFFPFWKKPFAILFMSTCLVHSQALLQTEDLVFNACFYKVLC